MHGYRQRQGYGSPFSRPLGRVPEGIPENERMRWHRAILAAIDNDVRPAYIKLAHYLARDYVTFLSKTTRTVGSSGRRRALPLCD